MSILVISFIVITFIVLVCNSLSQTCEYESKIWYLQQHIVIVSRSSLDEDNFLAFMKIPTLVGG